MFVLLTKKNYYLHFAVPLTPNNSADELLYENAVDLHAINTNDLLPMDETDVNLECYIKDPIMSDYPREPHLERVPDMVKVETDYKFEVNVINGDNNNWLFVPPLEKIFIKMQSVMNINVTYVPQMPPERLYVRAMILYSNPDEMHLPVKRCANHRETDASHELVHHILRSCHTRAYYQGHDEGLLFKDRLSVVVPLEHQLAANDGMAVEHIGLQFLCQNSCSSGINRRSTSMIFTLETHFGKILGKKIVQFKVCSCPKRDAERELPQLKRKTHEGPPCPRGKKPKYQLINQLAEVKKEPEEPDPETAAEEPAPSINTNSAGPITVTLKLPNAEVANHVLECAFNKIAGMMALERSDPNSYMKYLEHVRKLREAYANQ